MKKYAAPLVMMLASAFSLFLGFKVLRSVVAGFALYYLVCCIGLPLVDLLFARRLGPRRIAAAIGLAKPRRHELLVGLVSGLAMDAIMVAALALFRDRVFANGSVQATLELWGAGGSNLVLVFLVMLAFNGALEELFWRGYLHEKFSGMEKRLAALAIPSLFFGLQHVFVISSLVADPALVALFVFGITGSGAIWAFIRERWGLLSSVLSHVLVTAGYMAAFYFFALKPA